MKLFHTTMSKKVTHLKDLFAPKKELIVLRVGVLYAYPFRVIMRDSIFDRVCVILIAGVVLSPKNILPIERVMQAPRRSCICREHSV